MTDPVVAPTLPDGGALPFPPVPSASVAGRTLGESSYATRQVPRRLHKDSPNVVIVLIDDAGPGLPSGLGGVYAHAMVALGKHQGPLGGRNPLHLVVE